MDTCNKYTSIYCNSEFKIMLTFEGGNETWNFVCVLGGYLISYTGNELPRYFLIVLYAFCTI